MLTWKKSKAAFTLIELLVVVIIVAVLAAVGIPMLGANVERARVSEAESALGTIRTGMRVRLAEFNTFAGASGLDPIAANIGLGAGDLTGRFFADDDYLAITADADSFCAGVIGDAAGAAPRGDQVDGVERSIFGCTGASCVGAAGQEDGDIFGTDDCTGTRLN